MSWCWVPSYAPPDPGELHALARMGVRTPRARRPSDWLQLLRALLRGAGACAQSFAFGAAVRLLPASPELRPVDRGRRGAPAMALSHARDAWFCAPLSSAASSAGTPFAAAGDAASAAAAPALRAARDARASVHAGGGAYVDGGTVLGNGSRALRGAASVLPESPMSPAALFPTCVSCVLLCLVVVILVNSVLCCRAPP